MMAVTGQSPVPRLRRLRSGGTPSGTWCTAAAPAPLHQPETELNALAASLARSIDACRS